MKYIWHAQGLYHMRSCSLQNEVAPHHFSDFPEIEALDKVGKIYTLPVGAFFKRASEMGWLRSTVTKFSDIRQGVVIDVDYANLLKPGNERDFDTGTKRFICVKLGRFYEVSYRYGYTERIVMLAHPYFIEFTGVT